jgi:hypothetical protein
MPWFREMPGWEVSSGWVGGGALDRERVDGIGGFSREDLEREKHLKCKQRKYTIKKELNIFTKSLFLIVE